MNLDKNNIRRYAGYKGKFEIIEEIEEKIDKLIKEVLEKARVKYVYKILGVDIYLDEIRFENIVFKSKALAKNLENCNKIILLAITLGRDIDILIKRYANIDSSSMILLQAISTEYIEKYIDEIQKEILLSYDKDIYLKPRFSPGYSDFDISYQKDFINILNTSSKIGLSTTSRYMLVPSKSITAIIGITNIDYKNLKNKCNFCNMNNCDFKENI